MWGLVSQIVGGYINYMYSNQIKQFTPQYTEVRFASFLTSGFITAIVVNPPERKLAKRTSVQCNIPTLKD